jgi:hypothetical protein
MHRSARVFGDAFRAAMGLDRSDSFFSWPSVEEADQEGFEPLSNLMGRVAVRFGPCRQASCICGCAALGRNNDVGLLLSFDPRRKTFQKELDKEIPIAII